MIEFDNSFARDLQGAYVEVAGTRFPDPSLVVFNSALAESLGLPDISPVDASKWFSGHTSPQGARPLSMAYAGHQFGGFVPQLGDGRALLLGEVVDKNGSRFDIHLKGSGPTPFSRGGDGKAVLGPVLREFLMGEAMHALGIPTTRGLAATLTGESVVRQGRPEPGAVLTRIAQSHIRVGTFQFFAARRDIETLTRLLTYAVARYDPDLSADPNIAIKFFERVVHRQARLVAKWMSVGFVHGVMNTDNVTVSGETIDYGPCAFLDAYDPSQVFSSIDRQGRYAFGNQPNITGWNLARFAEALLPLLDPEKDKAIGVATEILEQFLPFYQEAWHSEMAGKLGLLKETSTLPNLVATFMQLIEGRDFTNSFRDLSEDPQRLLDHSRDRAEMARWLDEWRAAGPDSILMRQKNPVYIPRNHKVDEALAAATEGDMDPFNSLLSVLANPFEVQPGRDSFATPAPTDAPPFVTYCGT